MNITEILKSQKPTLSAEIFPPKIGAQLANAHEIISKIAELKPSFISITHGAGGGSTDFTLNLCDFAQNKCNLSVLAHLTAVNFTKDEIESQLLRFKSAKIFNILALRGDIIDDNQSKSKEMNYALDLMNIIKQNKNFTFSGACHPAKHPESVNINFDIEVMKRKINSGCKFFTTQLFFDNNILYGFLLKAAASGIKTPIVAGVMPVINIKTIKRICALNGESLPHNFNQMVDKFGNCPESLKQAGIAYATSQIVDLIANGVKNIHIYTMNKPEVFAQIQQNLSYIFN